MSGLSGSSSSTPTSVAPRLSHARSRICSLAGRSTTHTPSTGMSTFSASGSEYSGWQRDRVARLFRTGTAYYENRRVHSLLHTGGEAPILKNSMEHHMVDRSFDEYAFRLAKYGYWGAAQGWRDGKTPGCARGCVSSPVEVLSHLHHPARHPRWRARSGLLRAAGLQRLYEVLDPLGLANQRGPGDRAEPARVRRRRRRRGKVSRASRRARTMVGRRGRRVAAEVG